MEPVAVRLKDHKLLVTTSIVNRAELKSLSKFAEINSSDNMDETSILKILPDVDSVLLFSWPVFLTKENLAKMKRLKFIQSVLVGVNHIPFENLRSNVMISSNAGAYSLEVAEHAWALLLAAAKKIAEHHSRIREGEHGMQAFAGAASDILVLEGHSLGIIGYGGIGKMVGNFGRAFGMRVVALARRKTRDKSVTIYLGRRGLKRLLRESDAVVLALPLTRRTKGILGREELSAMKKTSVLVNVARGDLVDQKALYEHMVANPSFRYATDVWWFKEDMETLETDIPIARLSNFVGTPHMSGPTGIASGRPARFAVENTMRYLRGLPPRNVVDRAEYESM